MFDHFNYYRCVPFCVFTVCTILCHFLSINSVISVFTIQIPKRKMCTLNTQKMHFIYRKSKCGNVGHFMHSAVAALFT